MRSRCAAGTRSSRAATASSATCVVEVAPRGRGEGFAFAERVHGGTVPRQYFSSVEMGARDAMARGPLGFPVVDVAVTLIDGSYHTVNSSDMAFRAAARIALDEALPKARPVLLEPILAVTIYVPSDALARASALVSARRGQILGFEAREGWKGWEALRALIPEAEIGDLIIELRSATSGVGAFETKFDHLAELVRQGRRPGDRRAPRAQRERLKPRARAGIAAFSRLYRRARHRIKGWRTFRPVPETISMADATFERSRLATVFGGSGFLGRHIVRALARRGWRVRVAVRRPDLAAFLRPIGGVGQIEPVQANLRYPASIAAALEGAEMVVNAAGVKAESGAQTYKAVHVDGAAALARAAKAAGVETYVHISGIGADAEVRLGLYRQQGARRGGDARGVSRARRSCAPRWCSDRRTISSTASARWRAFCRSFRCSAAARPGCSRSTSATSRARPRRRWPATAQAGGDLRTRRPAGDDAARGRRTRFAHGRSAPPARRAAASVLRV